jgi:hypothetical protein
MAEMQSNGRRTQKGDQAVIQPFPKRKVQREGRGAAMGSSSPNEPLSQNLFPIEFSRNCLSDMEKRESDYGSNGRFQDLARTD